MIFDWQYEEALKNVQNTVMKLELDLELHKHLLQHLRVVVEEIHRKHPPTQNTA